MIDYGLGLAIECASSPSTAPSRRNCPAARRLPSAPQGDSIALRQPAAKSISARGEISASVASVRGIFRRCNRDVIGVTPISADFDSAIGLRLLRWRRISLFSSRA